MSYDYDVFLALCVRVKDRDLRLSDFNMYDLKKEIILSTLWLWKYSCVTETSGWNYKDSWYSCVTELKTCQLNETWWSAYSCVTELQRVNVYAVYKWENVLLCWNDYNGWILLQLICVKDYRAGTTVWLNIGPCECHTGWWWCWGGEAERTKN